MIGLSLIRILPQESSSTPSHARSASNTGSAAGDHETIRPLFKPDYVRRRTSSEIGGRAWSYAGANEQDAEATPSDSEADEVGGSGRQQTQQEERRGLLQEQQSPQLEHGSGAGKKKKDKTVLDITGWKLVKSIDFIILFLIMTMISGTGLLVINVRS